MSSQEKPTSYEELAQLVELMPLLLHEARRRRGHSMREAAKHTGCSFTTIQRIEGAKTDGFNSRALPALLRYLGGES